MDNAPVTPDSFISPLEVNTEIDFVSAHTIFPYYDTPALHCYYYQKVTFNGGQVLFENTYRRGVEGPSGSNIGFSTKLLQGNYTVYYEYGSAKPSITGGYVNTPYISATYDFAVIENHLPLKKWTITDVINRTLELAEPIRQGDRVRFRLNEEQAEQFDKILAPEFSFTRQTLRECLQEVGKFIHGEPRLKPQKGYTEIRRERFESGRIYVGSNAISAPYKPDTDYVVFISGRKYLLGLVSEASGADDDLYFEIPNSKFSGYLIVYEVTPGKGDWFYEVRYDMYAGEEGSNIQFMPYTSKGCQHVIENYAGWLDSTAENLVNQLDKYSGVIIEPYANGAKSVRTENQYVRIQDNNMLIATQYPIYTVDKLEYVYADGNNLKTVDITPYLFERSTYDSQLSSYSETYPYAKAYGLYFSQGERNIGGLNFKLDDAVFAAFNEYAIVNIIKRASGDSSLPKEKYPEMCFRVTYTPFYNARVAQTKPYFKDFIRPAALIFNQQSNVVESRYYGENLKGAIARLGNVEKSYTYLLGSIKEIPKAGQKFKKDYYISAVAVSILPTCIICTVGISKDFNRLSQYIGISSSKRYYEISQNQAVERNILYREYIVIGDKETPDSDCCVGNKLLEIIADTFTQNGGYSPITNVTAWGTTYAGNPINEQAINLPVISSAFGNSISFSWRYADNYSAGAVSQYVANAYTSGEVSGFFQNDAKYTDYYGRIYNYNFDLQLTGPSITAENLKSTAESLPIGSFPDNMGYVISTYGKQPFILRKDNREALQVNFQIDLVTNIDSLIIGSALASYCPAVRGTDGTLKPKLYVFPTELNKFTDHVEAFGNFDLSALPSTEISLDLDNVTNGYFEVNANAFPADGKAWAIVTAQQAQTKEVEDEQGNTVTQTSYYGGDLLIGQNIEIKAGQAFTPLYFTKKREIFDKTVWKDRR